MPYLWLKNARTLYETLTFSWILSPAVQGVAQGAAPLKLRLKWPGPSSRTNVDLWERKAVATNLGIVVTSQRYPLPLIYFMLVLEPPAALLKVSSAHPCAPSTRPSSPLLPEHSVSAPISVNFRRWDPYRILGDPRCAVSPFHYHLVFKLSSSRYVHLLDVI